MHGVDVAAVAVERADQLAQAERTPDGLQNLPLQLLDHGPETLVVECHGEFAEHCLGRGGGGREVVVAEARAGARRVDERQVYRRGELLERLFHGRPEGKLWRIGCGAQHWRRRWNRETASNIDESPIRRRAAAPRPT